MKKRNKTQITRKKAQITKIRNKSKTNINFTAIKNLIRERSKQWCISKLDNLDELDKFLAIHKIPKLTQEEIENINRFITKKEIKSGNKNFTTKFRSRQIHW